MGVFRHDLQRAAVFLGHLDAHQCIAEIIGHRLDNGGDPGFHARFLDIAFSCEAIVVAHAKSFLTSIRPMRRWPGPSGQ
jgi:hypothetical protein